jgi:hypothetical protein
MNEKRKTIGTLSQELAQKAPESRDPIELQREMQKDYLDHLLKCTEEHRKIFPGTFYILVLTKNERLMPNVFRNYFYARQSCPTPDYDQSVFVYNDEQEQIEYLWTIPSKDTCIHFKNNILQIAESERTLLKFILDFADGSLYKLAKKLNGEQEDSSELERK